MKNNSEEIRSILNLFEDDSKEFDLAKVTAGTLSLKQEKDVNALIAGRGLMKAAQGEVLTSIERDALKGYIDLFTTMLAIPNLRARLRAMQTLLPKKEEPEKSSKNEPEEDK